MDDSHRLHSNEMDGNELLKTNGDILTLLSTQFLTCGLCDNVYADPRELPCQHTFCRCCISRYVRNTWSADSASFSCPSCHVDIDLPSPQYADSAFQANVYISRLVHNFGRASSSPPGLAQPRSCSSSAVSHGSIPAEVDGALRATVRNTTVIRGNKEVDDEAYAMQLKAGICQNSVPGFSTCSKDKVSDSRQPCVTSPRQPTTCETSSRSTTIISCSQCEGNGTTLCSLCIANACKTVTQGTDQNHRSRDRQNLNYVQQRDVSARLSPPCTRKNDVMHVTANRRSSCNNSRETSPTRRQPQQSQTNVTMSTYVKKESPSSLTTATSTGDNCRCSCNDDDPTIQPGTSTNTGADRAQFIADVNSHAWSFVAEENISSAPNSPTVNASTQGSPRQSCCASSKLPVRQATVNTRSTDFRCSSNISKDELPASPRKSNSGGGGGGGGRVGGAKAVAACQVKDTCERHPDEAIISLCIDCRSLLCRVCLETVLLSPAHEHNHDSHFIIQLSVAADIIADKFDHSVRETRQCLDQCKCHLRSLKTQTMRDISRRCAALHELVRHYEEQLTKELEELMEMEDEAARKEQVFNELVATFNDTVARHQRHQPGQQSVKDDSRQLLYSIDIFRQMSCILQDVRGLRQQAAMTVDSGQSRIPRLVGGLDVDGGDRATAKAIIACLIGRLGGGADDDHALYENAVAQMTCLCQQAQAASSSRRRSANLTK